jgi:ubiquinone/menaquinone biosynthesis C-methylase UbiE
MGEINGFEDLKVRECWDNLAFEYDYEYSPKWFWINPEAWALEIERRIDSDSDKILDVGCGAGVISVPLSRKFDVTSLDFSLKMLLQLKSRKEDLKSELRIINADAHQLPFKDESFDVVVCRFAVWPLHEPQRAISEMVRVTRKKIVIMEGDWHKTKITIRHKIFGRPVYRFHFFLYRLKTGRNPKKQFEEMKKYHKSSTSFEKIKEWLENSGIEIKEADHSLKERVSTKKSQFLHAITGFEEDMFILIGEVRKDEKKT